MVKTTYGDGVRPIPVREVGLIESLGIGVYVSVHGFTS